jgi:hypothetical protein
MSNAEWIALPEGLNSKSRPELETPVLCAVHGIDHPVVWEIRLEYGDPMQGEPEGAVYYWDDPNNDGQGYDDLVVAWQPLPELPTEDSC